MNHDNLLSSILGPFTEYKIYVQAYTWKNNGNNSDTIVQRTDIVAPNAPEIVNLTCHPEDKVYLRWRKPTEYYNAIDLYVVSYRARDQFKFQEFSVQSLPMHQETSVRMIFFASRKCSIITSLDFPDLPHQHHPRRVRG